MGGKALEKYGIFTDRKDTEEFREIGKEIVNILQESLGLYSEIVKCFHTKESHGDLDVLIKINDDSLESNFNFSKYILSTFQARAINSNGGVYSFDYKNFQIDFIPVKAYKWDTAIAYYSYDPLGNIMGKTFHKFGLSYGWEGLFYKFRNFSGSNSADILLTNDVRKIFEFGGYDYERFLQGFDTIEDIFKFAIAGKYFDSEIFQMDNLKSIDKKRNRKRGSYHKFLEYLKENNIEVRYNFNPNKDTYLPVIGKYFKEANFIEKLNNLQKQDSLKKQIAQKFNGDLVMMWLPDLQGKELGYHMRQFRELHGEYYDEFILNNNYEMIRSSFMNMINKINE